MNTDLADFLIATDLDELVASRAKLSDLSSEDSGLIVDILQEWKDQQAIASLLMYPDLIPESIRFETILKGLQEPNSSYLRLAAIVGSDRLVIETPEQEVAIYNGMFDSIINSPAVIAVRASGYLVNKLLFSSQDYSTRIAPFLDHPNTSVKHNILAALIPLVGLKNIQSFLDQAIKSHELSESSKQYVGERLSSLEELPEPDKVDGLDVDLGGLDVPLLGYIPNFQDWNVD